MSLATDTDLERRMENALATRIRQCQPLAKLRMRRTSEDSARVNQDLILTAKRGETNPLFSPIYEMEVEITFTLKYRKSVDTLPQFLKVCRALETVFLTPPRELGRQLTACEENFICYELVVTGKDDSPATGKHSSVWTLAAIATSR